MGPPEPLARVIAASVELSVKTPLTPFSGFERSIFIATRVFPFRDSSPRAAEATGGRRHVNHSKERQSIAHSVPPRTVGWIAWGR